MIIGVLSDMCYWLMCSWPRNWQQVSSHPQCIAAAISAAKLQAFEFQRTRSLAPEKPKLPQVRRFEITPVTYQGRARKCRRDLPSARARLFVAPNVGRGAVSGFVNATRNIGLSSVHAKLSQGIGRPRARKAVAGRRPQ